MGSIMESNETEEAVRGVMRGVNCGLGMYVVRQEKMRLMCTSCAEVSISDRSSSRNTSLNHWGAIQSISCALLDTTRAPLQVFGAAIPAYCPPTPSIMTISTW